MKCNLGNMRSAFAARGKTEVELPWWHATLSPAAPVCDAFDDVIENALASGVVVLGDEIEGASARGLRCGRCVIVYS